MHLTPFRAIRTCAALALIASAASCASATKRYEQGQELEQQGRFAEAARRYIDALKKDATIVDARQRLVETGTRAVADAVREADSFETTGAHTDAADVLIRCDELVRDAGAVGVRLETPDSYSDRHALIFARAVDQAITQAMTASDRGDYSGSVRLIATAQQRWNPAIDQQRELNRVLRDSHIGWARTEMANSHFRSAYVHGEAAGSVPGFDRFIADEIVTEALRRGTMHVAIFPVGVRAGIDSRVLSEVNDLLALDHWQHPPQWIDVVNPIEAQRIARLRGLLGHNIDVQDASALARQIGVRLAVTMALDSVRYTESKVARLRRQVKTRAGVDTAFTIEDGQLETWARVSWRAIDASARSVVEHGDVRERASTSFRRATYGGNWRELDLSSADRTLFEQRDARENQEMLRHLARDLSNQLGREIFDALLRRVD